MTKNAIEVLKNRYIHNDDRRLASLAEERRFVMSKKAKKMYVTREELNDLQQLDRKMNELYDTELEKLFGKEIVERIHPGRTQLIMVDTVTKRFD